MSVSERDIMDVAGDRISPEPTSGCWLWTAGATPKGYPLMHPPGGGRRAVPLYVHRLSLALATGEEPADMVACHTCDVALCVNPRHLYWGTHADNTRDAVDRWRFSQGDNHCRAKLTCAAVVEAREDYARGESISSLARRHGISRSAMSVAVRGLRWKVVGHVN